MTLATARERADEARRLLAAGHDPIEHRKASRQAKRAASDKLTTVRQLVALYLAKHQAGWSNLKHRREWESSIDRLVLPVIGDMAASDVQTAHVLKVLEPLWPRIPKTTDRVRGRIEALLDFAKVADLRDGDNPARWDGHLSALLPAPNALKPTVHHQALPYAEVPGFMAALRAETYPGSGEGIEIAKTGILIGGCGVRHELSGNGRCPSRVKNRRFSAPNRGPLGVRSRHRGLLNHFVGGRDQ